MGKRKPDLSRCTKRTGRGRGELCKHMNVDHRPIAQSKDTWCYSCMDVCSSSKG